MAWNAGWRGGQPPGLDGLLVHEAREIVPDLAALGPGRGLGLRRSPDEGGRAPVREVSHLMSDAEGAPVRRNLRPLHPAPVGVGEEVVSGRHGAVHARQVEAVCRRGRAGRGAGLGWCRHERGDGQTEGEGRQSSMHVKEPRWPAGGTEGARQGAKRMILTPWSLDIGRLRTPSRLQVVGAAAGSACRQSRPTSTTWGFRSRRNTAASQRKPGKMRTGPGASSKARQRARNQRR